MTDNNFKDSGFVNAEEEKQFNRDMNGTNRYQVVIERCTVYEVDAYDEQDAEDMAWSMYSNDDLSDPFVAEVTKIEDQTS